MAVSHRVLVVCTANVCRSPVAAAMLAQRLDPTRFEVVGAGVRAAVGRPIDPTAAAELRARGIPLPEATARQLTPALVGVSDLVLTATRAHRAEVLDLEPRRLGRTFALVEFAALVDRADADDLDGLVAAAAAIRSSGPRDVDLPDPIGRPAEVHREVAARIEAAVATIARRLEVVTAHTC